MPSSREKPRRLISRRGFEVRASPARRDPRNRQSQDWRPTIFPSLKYNDAAFTLCDTVVKIRSTFDGSDGLVIFGLTREPGQGPRTKTINIVIGPGEARQLAAALSEVADSIEAEPAEQIKGQLSINDTIGDD